MPAPVYATREQLVDSPYLPDGVTPPAEAGRLLARASRRVDILVRTAVYDVDATGAPTSPTVAEALSEATCAQAAWWLETQDESGARAQYQSVGIGSVNLTRASGGVDQGDGTTSPAAVEVLTLAGLIGQEPIVGWGRGV